MSNPEFLKDDISQYIGEKVPIESDVYDGYEEPDHDVYEGEDEVEGDEVGEEEGYFGEDEGEFLMDADYLPGGDKYEGGNEVEEEGEEGGEDSKKKQKKKKASLTDLEGKDAVVDKLLEEYYQLNYEDFAGGKPTRFKYRKVEPTGYGLTPVEILLADEKELNSFVSLKKLAP
jgi:protein KRI1